MNPELEGWKLAVQQLSTDYGAVVANRNALLIQAQAAEQRTKELAAELETVRTELNKRIEELTARNIELQLECASLINAHAGALADPAAL